VSISCTPQYLTGTASNTYTPLDASYRWYYYWIPAIIKAILGIGKDYAENILCLA